MSAIAMFREYNRDSERDRVSRSLHLISYARKLTLLTKESL